MWLGYVTGGPHPIRVVGVGRGLKIIESREFHPMVKLKKNNNTEETIRNNSRDLINYVWRDDIPIVDENYV